MKVVSVLGGQPRTSSISTTDVGATGAAMVKTFVATAKEEGMRSNDSITKKKHTEGVSVGNSRCRQSSCDSNSSLLGLCDCSIDTSCDPLCDTERCMDIRALKLYEKMQTHVGRGALTHRQAAFNSLPLKPEKNAGIVGRRARASRERLAMAIVVPSLAM